jgi:hypothetical protein
MKRGEIMFNRKPKMRTSAEKARRSQLNVFARLAGCAYLIYIIVQLLGDEFDGLSHTARITISVVFIVLTAAVVTVTVMDFIKNLMSGAYKEGFYPDDFAGGEEADIEAFRARQAALGKSNGDEESNGDEDADTDETEDKGGQ